MGRPLALVVIAILLVTIFSGCIGMGPKTFTQENIVYPDYYLLDREAPTLPGPETDSPRNTNYVVSWVMTEVYIEHGGAMILSVENRGGSDLYIYRYGLRWLGTGDLHWRHTNVMVHPDQKEEVGLLYFYGPPSPAQSLYEVVMWSAVSNELGEWYDRGERTLGTTHATLRAPGQEANHTVEANPRMYYDAINKRVDFEVVEPIVSEIVSAVPLNGSLNQALEAYGWVRDNIAYKADYPEDYWQSAAETVELGTGDCEDQAILLVSILGALGLSPRVNIIEGHAFPTLFVTDSVTDLEEVREVVSRHYWTEVPVYFLHDDLGYWMVLDTTGFPYAGGLPALSSPTGEGGYTGWSFDTSGWLMTIDVTGHTSGWGFLPF